jgi:hypothetical protein
VLGWLGSLLPTETDRAYSLEFSTDHMLVHTISLKADTLKEINGR